MYMSPLILLVLEPDFAGGEAAVAAGLAVWILVRIYHSIGLVISYRTNGGNIDMLDAFLSLDRCIYPSCGCGY